MRISAVILAAGEGKRIGVPKAVLKIKGRNLADIQYEFFRSFDILEIKIVIGAEANRVRELLEYKDAVVVNDGYKDGQFSSLVKGVNSLKVCDGVLIIPVDVYPVERGVVLSLIAGFEYGYDAVVPVFEGRRGHPVILNYKFALRLSHYDVLSSRLDYILKDAGVKAVKTESRSILNNINFPSERPEDS